MEPRTSNLSILRSCALVSHSLKGCTPRGQVVLLRPSCARHSLESAQHHPDPYHLSVSDRAVRSTAGFRRLITCVNKRSSPPKRKSKSWGGTAFAALANWLCKKLPPEGNCVSYPPLSKCVRYVAFYFPPKEGCRPRLGHSL